MLSGPLISACRACGLCETRRSTVPGEGNPHAELLFVGEGPGADEDASGRPFVGAAGQLLTKMIIAMGLRREDVFIANIGNTPLRALMNDDQLGITRMRGKKLQFDGITLIPTFHPSYLLRNEEAKKPCWDDLKVVLKELGRELPKRGG